MDDLVNLSLIVTIINLLFPVTTNLFVWYKGVFFMVLKNKKLKHVELYQKKKKAVLQPIIALNIDFFRNYCKNG